LNSITPDSTLLGSAWGNVGEEQIARIRQAVQEKEWKEVMILVHHPPVRWSNDRPPEEWSLPEISDWANLSQSAAAAAALRECVRLGTQHGKMVVVLCGHRHGGQSHAGRVGEWGGGVIGEGAALVDNTNNAILQQGGQLRVDTP
jgi:hypothetical protein